MQNPCIFQIFVVPLQTEMKKYAQVILLSLFFVLPMVAQAEKAPSAPVTGIEPIAGRTAELVGELIPKPDDPVLQQSMDVVLKAVDTVLCDTVQLPVFWYRHVWTEPGTVSAMLKDSNGKDSVRLILTLQIENCDKCKPILVNKFDRFLFVDNAKVRELFPEREVLVYQWFKNDTLIEDATEDEYLEETILHGVYQVFLTLDDATEVCSNIIDLSNTVVPTVTTIRAYNSRGVLIGTWQTSEPNERPQLPAGIYLLLIEQGGQVYREKVFVP